MRIETVTGPFGLDPHDVLVLSKREVDTLKAASTIMRRARDMATDHVGPDFVDSDADGFMAEGEYAFVDILGDGSGVRFDLGEL